VPPQTLLLHSYMLLAPLLRPELTSVRPAPPVMLSGGSDLAVALFDAQVGAEALVANQLQHLTPLSALVLYGAGLLTAFSPCCLSMLPLTTAVIAGLEDSGGADASSAAQRLRLPAAFALGLASALAAAGVAAALTGRLYGQSSGAAAGVLPALVAVLAASMGLNLLQARPPSAHQPGFARRPTPEPAATTDSAPAPAPTRCCHSSSRRSFHERTGLTCLRWARRLPSVPLLRWPPRRALPPCERRASHTRDARGWPARAP
jgi:hypothetical protein